MGCCGRAPIEKIICWEENHFFSSVLLNSISKCLIQAKFRHKIRALGSGCDFQHRVVLGKQNPTKHHPTKAGCSQDCWYPLGAHPLPKQYHWPVLGRKSNLCCWPASSAPAIFTSQRQTGHAPPGHQHNSLAVRHFPVLAHG